MTMQELLKLQAAMTEKNTLSINLNTHAANDLKVDVKKLSEIQIKAANDEEYKKKRQEQVSDSLKQLNVTIREAIKNGFGAATGEKINSDTESRGNVAGANSKLRDLLLGGKKGDEQVQSITGIRGAIDKWLSKRDDKAALKQEKKEFVKNAMEHDPSIYARRANFAGGKKTAEGRAIAQEEAEKRFDEIKEKEAAVKKAHDKIEAAKAAGFAPLKQDIKDRDKATKELALVDTRMKPQMEGHTVAEEEKASKSKFQADQVKSEVDQVVVEQGIGKTLIESLDVQKQQLAAIVQMAQSGGAGAGGSSIMDTVGDVADLASNAGGKGKGFLSKAGKFLGKAGPGLLKGGIGALGGMALEAGGDALIENGHEKVGGAVSTLGTAASYAGTGAMIGSVVPGVGTAIGAGVGGAIGLGKGLYDNWNNIFGGKKENMTTAKPEEIQYDEMGNAIGTSSGDLNSASKTNEELKHKNSSAPTVVNAPTTINNNGSKGGGVDIRSPLRNQESSVNSYIQNRYA